VLSAAVAQGNISIDFAAGTVGATVTGKDVTSKSGEGRPETPRRAPRKPSGGQGSLL
jgi:hypothetical protein